MGSTLFAVAVPVPTVSRAAPGAFPDLAAISVVPEVTIEEVAKPLLLSIVATSGAVEVQVTNRGCCKPSEKVPVTAVYCSDAPKEILENAGSTSIDTSAAGFTVRITGAETIFPDAAAIVVVPVPFDVANPCKPAELLIVATVRSDEVHVTDVVRSCIVPSE